MQLSARERDFVVDTMKLRGKLGGALKDICANPNVTKVLHGSDYDVEWLYKDVSLHIVNLFDTG